MPRRSASSFRLIQIVLSGLVMGAIEHQPRDRWSEVFPLLLASPLSTSAACFARRHGVVLAGWKPTDSIPAVAKEIAHQMSSKPAPPKRRINSWIRSYQSVWDEVALDHEKHPDWFRVFALAVARAGANGHANFASGEVADVLGETGLDGTWIPKPSTGVSQTISLAKSKGLLCIRSNARCLVLPSHAWQGGMGSANTRCPMHG